MSDPILVALIAAAASVLTSTLGLFATRKNGRKISEIQQDTRASRAQVENSHTTNLRIEQDERHAEIIKRFDRHDERFDNVEKDIRGLRRDVGRLDKKDEKLDDRIHDLEVSRSRTLK